MAHFLKLGFQLAGLVRTTTPFIIKHVLRKPNSKSLFEIPFNFAPSSPQTRESLLNGNLENIQTKITDNQKRVNLSEENLSQLHSNVPKKEGAESKDSSREITGTLNLYRLMGPLERKISQEVTKEHCQFFEFLNRKPEWREELDLIVSPSIQELIVYLQDNPMTVKLPPDWKEFRFGLKYHRVSEAEAKVLWDLIHKYLMKDGELDLPDEFQ